jgi:hypothetical protein
MGIMGDFNCILEADKYRGNFTPSRSPMEDYQQWTNENDLVHLPTRGAAFTWNNGRSGYMYTKTRLD